MDAGDNVTSGVIPYPDPLLNKFTSQKNLPRAALLHNCCARLRKGICTARYNNSPPIDLSD